MSILEVKNLTKIYHNNQGETLALDNIDFSVNEGEFISLVGPSGCGKSTLLSIIGGITNKSKGNINYQKNCKMGYMFQSDTLFDWLTILDNCLLGLKISNNLTEVKRKKVIDLLENYGLKDFIYSYPKQLSGGMRQRVALIRTLATSPDIILLDEPFSALDYQTRLSVSEDVYNIIKKEKKTVIMVTHDIAEAISMSDRIIILSNRPAIVKNIYAINLSNKSGPIENRKAKEFSTYYDKIWKELDIHV